MNTCISLLAHILRACNTLYIYIYKSDNEARNTSTNTLARIYYNNIYKILKKLNLYNKNNFSLFLNSSFVIVCSLIFNANLH